MTAEFLVDRTSSGYPLSKLYFTYIETEVLSGTSFFLGETVPVLFFSARAANDANWFARRFFFSRSLLGNTTPVPECFLLERQIFAEDLRNIFCLAGFLLEMVPVGIEALHLPVLADGHDLVLAQVHVVAPE